MRRIFDFERTTRCLSSGILVALVCLPAIAKPQQEVRGIVRERVTGQPLAGAVISILDSTQTVLVRGRSTESGRFSIAAIGTAVTIRVQRLGFAPRQLRLDDRSGALEIRMDAVPALLQSVEVKANPQCPVRSDYARAHSLLEQARSGVLSFVLSRDLTPAALVRATYTQRVQARRRIVAQSVDIDSTKAADVSFVSPRSGADFVARGFRNDSAGELLGPDAAVLLDEDFARGYCFQIASSDNSRPNQAGLAFSPARRKSGRVDINGVLWIDTLARKLVNLEYKYVGLGEADALAPGGQTSFHELSNGIVLVDRWSIHFPEYRRTASVRSRSVDTSIYSPDMMVRNGGDVLLATWPDGSVWRPPHPSLRVRAVARDGRPLSGVRVSLANTDYVATSDSSGTAFIGDLIPGRYEIVVSDPRLPQADLMTGGRPFAEVDGDSTSVASAMARSLTEYAIERCRNERRFVTAEAPMVGYVRTAEGSALADGEVTYGQPRREPLYRIPLRGDDGVFALCLGRAQRVDSAELRVNNGAFRGRTTTVHGDRFQVVTIDLEPGVGARVSRPLRGLVFDSLHGRPMVGALVRLDGTRRTALTDSNGFFLFDSVFVGSHTITAEHDAIDAVGLSRLSGTFSATAPDDVVRLALPSFESFWRRVCGNAKSPIGSVIVVGRVSSADSPRKLSATVDGSWTTDTTDASGRSAEARGTIQAKSDSEGHFALCGVPGRTAVHIRAVADSASTDLITVSPSVEDRVVFRELIVRSRTFGTSAPGVITGQVLGDSTPLGGARVSTQDGTVSRALADGRFTLAGVGAGTRQIEGRAIGYAPATAIVDVRPNDTARVVLRLSKATVLDSVLVTAQREHVLRSFEEHRKMGIGKFLDAEELKNAEGAKLSTLIRQWPGVFIPSDPTNSYPQTTRGVKSLLGGCDVAVFLDGRLLDPKLDKDLDRIAPPDLLAGVEWYPGSATIPPEYARPNAHCGVLVLHSKYKTGKLH